MRSVEGTTGVAPSSSEDKSSDGGRSGEAGSRINDSKCPKSTAFPIHVSTK